MFIKGQAITLRPLEIEDADIFYMWSQDREITQFSLSSFAYPKSQSDIATWLSTINQNPKNISFGICCIKTGKLVGYAGIVSISQINRSGEFFILIGDKHYWDKGVATDVTQLVNSYGFRDLGLHRIELTAFSDNKAAIRAYEKAGYQHEGIKRQAGFRHGGFYDKVQMSVLVSDEMPEQKMLEPEAKDADPAALDHKEGQVQLAPNSHEISSKAED